MGYRIKNVDYSIGWKINFEVFIDGVRQSRDIPKSEWVRLGFNTSMSRDEALERARVLNAQLEVKRLETKRAMIASRLTHDKVTQIAYLSGAQEFENKLTGKSVSHWNSARIMLTDLKIAPEEWADRANEFYEYFEKKQWSNSHVQKMIYLMNKWAAIDFKKRKQYFEPLRTPRGRAREKINDSYFDKRENGLTSEPLLPNELERQKDKLKVEQYNWLYISIWFGLRPSEIDIIGRPSSKTTWYIENGSKGKVLWVYQKKLSSVPKGQRTKPIPCVRDEQLIGLNIIENCKIQKPLTKTLKRYFGENIRLYAGRKGFTDLMLSFGYKLEDISVWLGHRSIERTWKSYKDKQRVVFPD
jgi:hypothetical protein